MRSDGSVIFMRWNDNCLVTSASHCFTVTPGSKTERLVKYEHTRAVELTHVVKVYDQGMPVWMCVLVCCHRTDRGCDEKSIGETYLASD